MAEAGPSNQGHAALSRALDAFDAAVTETTQHLVESWQSKPSLTDVDLTSQLIPRAQRLRDDVYALIGEEEAQRSTLRDLATSQLRLALSSIDVEATSLVYAHLDFATSCQEAALIDDGVPLTLIEELNERIPVDSIHSLFAYLESRVSWLTRNLSPSKGKGLVLLRLLNDMLRRLSKPSREHLVLSGRILALLASVFPLGERSGVNLRGDFNTANVTRIDEDDEQPVKRGTEDDEDEDDKDADPASLAARDSSFYRAFWALQNAFSNPALLFEPAPEPEAPTSNDSDLAPPVSTSDEKQHDDEGRSEEAKEQSGSADAANDNGDGAAGASSPVASLSPFQIFRNTTSRVLDVFSDASAREKEMSQAERAASKGGRAAAKAAAATAAAADAPGAAEESLISAKKRKRDEMLQHNAAGSLLGLREDTSSGGEDAAAQDSLSQFPKYLTGRRVFEYELRSPHFRRHVLVQYLILLQYLLTFTAAQRKRRAEAEPLRNRQLVVAAAEWELSEEEEQWVRSTWRNVVGLLEDTAATATASAQAAASSTASKAVLSHDAGAGRAFRASVLQTLRREARWVQWKSDNCPPIDRKPLTAAASASEEEGSQHLRARLEAAKDRLGLTPARRRRRKLTWSVGTSALSELWENGLEPIVPQSYKRRRENSEGIEVEVEEHTDGLEQLEVPPGIPSLRSYAQRVKREEQLAAMRKEKVDEERKTSLQWRGLRVARGDSLRLWGKIGGGEVEMLLAAEKQEEEEEEETKKKRQQAASVADASEEKGRAAPGDETIKPDDVKSEAPAQAAAAATEKEEEHDADATFMTAVDDGGDEREGDAETDVAVTATPTTPPVDVDVDVPSSDLDAPAATSSSESGAIKSDDREPGEEGENSGDGDVEMTS